MQPISDVVDEVIQNCPIDVRRPLYKVNASSPSSFSAVQKCLRDTDTSKCGSIGVQHGQKGLKAITSVPFAVLVGNASVNEMVRGSIHVEHIYHESAPALLQVAQSQKL